MKTRFVLLVFQKIVDIGSTRSNHHDSNEEKIPRQSPQQKRPASPVALADEIVSKKVKLDPTIKKKQLPTAIKTENTTKTIVNKKKPTLASCKSSSVLDEKVVKPPPMKESNSSTQNNNNSTIESKCIRKH